MKKIIIYGAGPYGKIFFSDVQRYGAIDVVGFTVDKIYLKEKNIEGLSVIPFEDVEKMYPPDQYDMIVVCGYSKMRNRKKMYDKAKAKGYKLRNYISPGAYLENKIEMGDNNIILSGSDVGYDGKMGSNNIINQNVYLAHEFVMGSHNILSYGCIIGGYSRIKDLSFFGFAATASGYKSFGKECLVGMRSVVTRDVEDYATVYGAPAKVVSYHRETGVVINEGFGQK